MSIISSRLGKFVLFGILGVFLFCIGVAVYLVFDAKRAQNIGFVIPDRFMERQTIEVDGIRTLIDPYPHLDWVEGYTVGAYQSLEAPVLKWSGKPCKIFRNFCEGTDVDSVFSVVLLNKNKDVVAAFTLHVNLLCAQRREHFTREKPVICESVGVRSLTVPEGTVK